MELLNPPWIEELERIKKEETIFLPVAKLSRITGVSGWTIRRAIYSGEIDAFKIRGMWVVHIDSFIEFTKRKYNLNLD